MSKVDQKWICLTREGIYGMLKMSNLEGKWVKFIN